MKKTIIAAAVVLICAASGYSAEKAKTVIEFWEADYMQMQPVLDRLIADFEKQNGGIRVKRTHYEGTDLRNEFTAIKTGVKSPDLLHVPNGEIAVFVPQNLISPVAEIMGERFFADFTRSALEASAYNGKAYMVPDRDGNELCLIINRDLVAKVPGTFDELIAAGVELRSQGKVVYPLVFNMVEPFFSLSLLGAFGEAVFDDPQSERAMPTLSTPAVTEWCRFLVKLQQDGVIPRMTDYDAASDMFKSGKAAFIINGSWSFDDYIHNAEMKIAVAPIPAINGRRPSPYSAVKGYMVPSSVTKNQVKKGAVKKFIAFMTSKKAQLALCGEPDILPSRRDALKDKLIANDPLRAPRAAQLEYCRPMPVAPQMRAVWDGMTAVQANLFSGKTAPEKAPRRCSGVSSTACGRSASRSKREPMCLRSNSMKSGRPRVKRKRAESPVRRSAENR